MTRARIQAAGFVLGLLGLVLVVVSLRDDVDRSLLPGPAALAVAAGLVVVSLVAAGHAWSTLLDAGPAGPSVRGALYLSQLSKYLPAGGILQAAGQVTMSSDDDIPVRRAAVAYPVAALQIVVCGLVLSGGLAFVSSLPVGARLAAAVAPLSLLAVHPRVLERVLRAARRLSRRIPDDAAVPAAPLLGRALMWSMLNMVAVSVAYAALLRSLAPEVDLAVVTVAFAASWVAGFLVVPLPSGLGVRELVLVAAVPDLAAATVLAASLAHRLVTVGAEVTTVVTNRVQRRRP